MIVPLKRKYRPNPSAVPKVATGKWVSGEYYYAKKIPSGSNDGRRRKRSKSGDKTYDRTKHILYIYPSGKQRMIHL